MAELDEARGILRRQRDALAGDSWRLIWRVVDGGNRHHLHSLRCRLFRGGSHQITVAARQALTCVGMTSGADCVISQRAPGSCVVQDFGAYMADW